MILRLYLDGGGSREMPARVTHDPLAGRTSLVVDWPEDLDGKLVLGFTLSASTGKPLVLQAGETLLLPLPPVIGIEP